MSRAKVAEMSSTASITKEVRKEVVNDARRHKMSARNIVSKFHIKEEEETFDQREEMLKAMSMTQRPPEPRLAMNVTQIINECGIDCKDYYKCTTLFQASSSSSSSSAAAAAAAKNRRSTTDKATFDDILTLCTSLHLFRTKMGLSIPCNIQDIIDTFMNLYYPDALVASKENGSALKDIDVDFDISDGVKMEQETIGVVIKIDDSNVNSDNSAMDVAKNEVDSSKNKSISDLFDEFERDSGINVNVNCINSNNDNNDNSDDDDEEDNEKDGGVSRTSRSSKNIEKVVKSSHDDNDNDDVLNAQMIQHYIFERLQLILTKEILPDVSAIYSLEGFDNRAINTKSMIMNDIPLNQLTYKELARISLVHYMLEEMSINKTSEEAEYYIRGEADNTPYTLSKKSVLQLIRAKMAARARLQMGAANVSEEMADKINSNGDNYYVKISENIRKSYHKCSIIIDDYNANMTKYVGRYKPTLSSDDIIEITSKLRSNALDFDNNSCNLSSVYRRMSKIFIKVVELNEYEFGILFGDSRFNDSDYNIRDGSWFDNKHSLTMAQIAQMLVNEEYTNVVNNESIDSSSDAAEIISVLFYDDVMKYLLTISTFHTSIAIKLLMQKAAFVLNRFVDAYLLDFDNNGAEFDCNEEKCLLSRFPITTVARADTIFCSKCTSAHNVDGLKSFYNTFHNYGENNDGKNSYHKKFGPFLFLPHVVSSHNYLSSREEVWMCPFCVREDTCRLAGSSDNDDAFIFNEYGASLLLPWQLNKNVSISVERKLLENPTVKIYMNALKILAGNACSNDVFHDPSSNGSKDFVHDLSPEKRLQLLLGLCEGTKASSKGSKVLESVYKDGAALFELARSNDTRPGEFAASLSKLCGEHVAISFTNYLCQISRKKSFETALKAVDGRCVVCKKSSDDSQHNKVILCDFCNGETHLSCSGLTTITRSSYFCLLCQKFTKQHEQRMEILNSKIRKEKSYSDHLKDFSVTSASINDIHKDGIKYFFDNIEDFREHKAEDSLIDRAIQRKIETLKKSDTADDHNHFSKNIDNRESPTKCKYCDFTEMDLCSPLVIGQSRSEHDEYVSTFLNRLKQEDLNQIASSQQEQATVNVNISPPYFPRLDLAHSKVLLDEYANSGIDPDICHEFCALHLFQHRLKTGLNEAKVRRLNVTNKALSLCSIKTLPLGFDSSNRSYWYFSCSPNLFVYCNSSDNTTIGDDKYYVNMSDDFKKFCPNYNTIAKDEGVWKVVINNKENIQNVQNIINNLSNTSNERDLKNNLISFFITTNDVVDVNDYDTHDEALSDYICTTASTKSSAPNGGSSNNDNANLNSDNASVASSDNVPCKITLSSTSAMIEDVYFIGDTSSVCQEVERTSPEGFDPKDYMKYQKNGKFFCVTVLNSSGIPLRFTKNSGISMTFQVHHELLRESLVCENICEQWQSDLAYYFQVPLFRRAGRYILTFLLEGKLDNSAVVDPLVFEVNVNHRSAVTGFDDAIDQMKAHTYHNATGRCFIRSSTDEIINTSSELQAVKSSLLCLYYALPVGSIVIDNSTASCDSQGVAPSDMFSKLVANAGNTWSDLLDQTWRGAIATATSALILMECCILLESCIDRSWVLPPFDQYIDSVLPRASYAVRAATLSSVALRVYYLDRAIDYNKIIRARKHEGRTTTAYSVTNSQRTIVSKATHATEVTSSGRISRKIFSNFSNDSIQEIENDHSAGGRARVKRAAAYQASNNIKKQVCEDRVGNRSFQ